MTDEAIRREILGVARDCSDCRVRYVPPDSDHVSFCSEHRSLAEDLDELGQP